MGNFFPITGTIIFTLLYILYKTSARFHQKRRECQFGVFPITSPAQQVASQTQTPKTSMIVHGAPCLLPCPQNCDTVWKCFLRAVWLWPQRAFLGGKTDGWQGTGSGGVIGNYVGQ